MNWKIYILSGRRWYSRIIQFYSWSIWSHVAIGNEVKVWEATTPRVRSLGLPQFMAAYKGTKFAELTFARQPLWPESAALTRWLNSHVGDRYDTVDLLRFLARDDKAKPDDRWICSEFVAEASATAGQPLQARIPAYKLRPVDIWTSPTLKLIRFGTWNGTEFQAATLDLEKAL